MVLILFLIVAYFLPWPWSLVAVVVGIVAEVGEIAWGRRLARRWRPQTGAEALIGRSATVVQACRPDGLVRTDGETWQASCPGGADVGDTVRIDGVRGLTLDVVRVPTAQAPPRQATNAG